MLGHAFNRSFRKIWEIVIDDWIPGYQYLVVIPLFLCTDMDMDASLSDVGIVRYDNDTDIVVDRTPCFF